MEPIRVLICDDHAMIRRGLRSLLSSFEDIRVVGEASDGATAVQAVTELAPDVLLLDVQMTGPDGIAVGARVHREFPQLRIIILSAYDDDEYIKGALQAGASAYLLKSSSDETVVEAIREVHRGKRFLTPALMDRVLQQYQDVLQDQVKNAFGLTSDELQVLRLIAQGATNEEIAKEMYWGERTVKRKVEEIMIKMGARNRAQAVAEAIKKGVI